MRFVNILPSLLSDTPKRIRFMCFLQFANVICFVFWFAELTVQFKVTNQYNRVRPRFFDQVGHETMHLVEISIFSLNIVIVRPTKIMNRAKKFRHNFRKWSILKNKIFKIFLIKVGLLAQCSSYIFFLEIFYQYFSQKNDFESTNFEMFEEDVHNFGKSDNNMI